MSREASDLRIGLVGCGRLAERGYVPALSGVDGLRLVAVADPVSERCAAVAPGVAAFASAAGMVESIELDALILASPATVHLADARIAAEAGLHTLVEKPPAPTLADTVELAGLSPAPCFSFNRRFVPALERLRDSARNEYPLDLRLELRTRRSSWRSHEVRDEAMLGLAPHLIDLVRWIGGTEVGAVRGEVSPDRATLDLVLAGGKGRASVACASNRPYREQVSVTAPSGRLGSYSAGGIRAWLRAGAGAHPLVPSLVRQLEAFARVVRGEEEHEIGRAADAVAVMAVIEAAHEASARRAEVPVHAPSLV